MLKVSLFARISSELSRERNLPALVWIYIKNVKLFLLKLYLYLNFFHPTKICKQYTLIILYK